MRQTADDMVPTATTAELAPTAGADHPIDVNELIADLGDAGMTQGPSGDGSDGLWTLGDMAELTLGSGTATQEAKRHVYN
ncbi:MAG: albusnodin family lasso peptide [Pseudonocardiaceae bacterium]